MDDSVATKPKLITFLHDPKLLPGEGVPQGCPEPTFHSALTEDERCSLVRQPARTDNLTLVLDRFLIRLGV